MLDIFVHFRICFFKQKTAYEMRISDWSSDVCSSDLLLPLSEAGAKASSAGLAGAVKSIVISRGVDATEALPAKSVATTIKLYVPSEIGRASRRERVCQYV